MDEMPRLVRRAIFYVYVLFDWNGTPFYVGKGKKNRWLTHEQKSDPKNQLKNEIVEQTWIMLGEIPKIKVCEYVSQAEAFAIEIALIKAIGRRDRGTGPLANMTNGGEGMDGHISPKKGISTGPWRWITNGINDRMIRPADPLPEKWRYGRTDNGHTGMNRTPTARLNMSISASKRKASAKTRQHLSNIKQRTIWITNGATDKMIDKDTSIPDGWDRGRSWAIQENARRRSIQHAEENQNLDD